LGTHTSRTPTLLFASISLRMRVASSIGWSPPRKASVKRPSMAPPSRRSNSLRMLKGRDVQEIRGARRRLYPGVVGLLPPARTPHGAAVTIACAGRVAELADAQDSGSCPGNRVE